MLYGAGPAFWPRYVRLGQPIRSVELRSFTDMIDLKISIQCSFWPASFKIMFPGSQMDILLEYD